MPDSSFRICCIGFQKTGTTSTTEALRRLGFTSCTVHRQIRERLAAEPGTDPRAVSEAIAIEALKTADVIEDSPMPFIYEALDRAYPGSKFILTWRPVEKWLTSYRNFFADENHALRAWMYGVDRLSGNEDHYREVYERQNAAIRAYFADRPGDFLEMNLAEGDGWQELVNFIGKDRLPRFPHVNAGNPAGRQRGGWGIRRRLARALGR